MSGKTTKSLLSSRIVSLLKKEKQCMKNSEFSVLETALKDDLVRHNWLYSLLNAAINNCTLISSEDLDCWKSSSNNLSSVDAAAVESLNGEIAFYQQKVSLLKKQKEWLKKRISRLKSEVATEQQSVRYSVSELKVKQLLVRLEQSNNDKFSCPNTREVVDLMVSQLNASFERLSDSKFEELLDELSLVSRECDKSILVATFYEKYFEKLSSLKERLVNVQQKCKELLEFYNDIVKKELSWRKEMNSLSQELLNNSCLLYDDNSVHNTEFSDLLSNLNDLEVPSHEIHDELNDLMERLKEKTTLL